MLEFFYFGLIPEDLRDSAIVDETGPKVCIFIPCSNTFEMRARLLKWFEAEFFNYEEEPYLLGDSTDVATLRSAYLPKPIVVSVYRESV